MSSSSASSGGLPDSQGPAPLRRTVHQPVLVREVLRLLAPQPGQTIVDGTVGAGGHAQHILKLIGPRGTLFGLDRDAEMLDRAGTVLSAKPQAANCHLVQASYSELRTVLDRYHVAAVDGILLDLGLSSDQLADDRRGFGFASTELDMRFDPREGRPASELLATADESELERIFREYGEEPHSRQIAAEIVQRRRQRPIATAVELSDLVARLRLSRSRAAKPQAAAQVFQALRIAVNEELRHLETMLHQVFRETLRAGGRAVVITFHSLEDRLVKTAFRDKDQWENLTAKPVTATSVEKKMNPRSRAAKLRAAVWKGTAAAPA
jgi:16S rRNA (cytosine1402-N4)-methyltransferase